MRSYSFFTRTVVLWFFAFAALKTPPVSFLSAAQIHAILIGDLDSRDICSAISNDLSSIEGELERISDYTGLTLSQTVFVGATVRSDKVLSFLTNLKVNRDDVILFYFSGHGYRTLSKGENPWPNLYFSKESVGIDFADCVDMCREKEPRLGIFIADCCNNVISEQAAPAMAKRTLLGRDADVRRVSMAYKKLFVEADGLIVIAGSKAEQTSLALNTGSLYTTSFLISLREIIQGSSAMVSWTHLLDKASYLTELTAQRFDEVQEPIYWLN